MDAIQILGLFAAVSITLANFPQFYKILKNKSARDISAPTYIMLVIGNSAWLVYGILKSDVPIIIGNSISTLMCALILGFKISSRKSRD